MGEELSSISAEKTVKLLTPVILNYCLSILNVNENEELKPQQLPDYLTRARARIKEIQANSEIIELLIESVDESLNDEGWAMLSEVGSRISLKDPDFDVNNYGFKKMSDFFRSLDIFEVQEIMRDDKVVNVFVRPIDF